MSDTKTAQPDEKRSSRSKAFDAEKLVLQWLTRFGYASTRQLALIMYGDLTDSTRKMANRTVGRLLEKQLIVARRDDIAGERLVALNQRGTAACASELPFGKPHGRDWLRTAHEHRTHCNSVLASAYGYGIGGWSELEIRAGDAPLDLCRFQFLDENGKTEHKIPDLILQKGDKRIWVEVERSYRSGKDFVKCLRWLRTVYHWQTPAAGAVDEVWFVITRPGAKTIGRRLRAALTPTPEDGRPLQAKNNDGRILAHLRVFEFDHDSLMLSSVNF